MKERPILFSGPMVRALLAGTKTQTRRVVKKSESWPMSAVRATMLESRGTAMAVDAQRCTYGPEIKCPYGKPGDRLWVREAWGLHAYGDDTDWLKGCCTAMDLDDHVIAYRADWGPLQDSCHWRPSIHMPRAASRTTLEIAAVRVERLQDISEADALAEGVKNSLHLPGGRFARENFAHLWWTINGDGSWEENPWVWVVEFRRLT